MIQRVGWAQKVRDYLQTFPVVGIIGPRQCGKTTLAKSILGEFRSPELNYFDLEDTSALSRLASPMSALNDLRGLIVIDEIHHRPELFPTLRVLADRANTDARFLVLGSASIDLLRQTSESLAGRIGYLEMTPFALRETGLDRVNRLWIRGGLPRSYLAPSETQSVAWRENYVRTFLERDLTSFGFNLPAQTMRRFWMMLAHYHGQTFNASEIARSMGVSSPTAQRYLDALSGTFMIRQLPPWFENVGKRQIKSNKVYFRDSGLYHRLLGLDSYEELQVHPKLGASWEGFALEETLRALAVADSDAYFWGVHEQAEIDLMILRGGKRYGFEFKYGDAPRKTRSIDQAIQILQLQSVAIVYPGRVSYRIDDKTRVLSLLDLVSNPEL